MARAKISEASKSLISDNGAIIASLAIGEQIQLNMKFEWLTSIDASQVRCTAVEGINDGNGSKPTGVKPNGVVRDLDLIIPASGGNNVIMVLPKDLGLNFDPQPQPDHSVFAYIDIEVSDTAVGVRKQIWKPFRGLVELLYSPTGAN